MKQYYPEQVSEDKLAHLERLLTVKQLQINSLLEVSQAINNNFSTSALFRIYEFILRAQMGIQRLLVFIKNDRWDCVCNSGITDMYKQISVDIDLIQFRNIATLTNTRNEKLREFDVIIPVYHKDIPLAYVLIGDLKTDDNDSVEEKLKFIQTITNIVIVAVENKKLFNSQIQQEVMRKELEFAAKMQSMLIPSDLPNNSKVEMASVYLPHHDIGGDYYDCIELSETELAFCIGDISGKGIAAALLMANFQANLRTEIVKQSDLAEFIQLLNVKVNQITKGEKFITLFLGVYNYETRVLRYVNAGHNPPLLVQGNQIIELDKGCTLLGMFEQLPAIKIGEVTLANNSVLINYTDGLIDFENANDEFFSLDRLESFLSSNYHLGMAEFNKKLLDYVSDFKGEALFIDDITILSCRFL
ncbi:MAG: PP2C family protein-serine/threonine phosphatase [Chitinophagales bacterium]|nr:PP2C family protein-serine/threonine phosphatase [Chitinophagales bacterium]